MDANIQIQTIKAQIENLKFQIDNIEIQNNNNMNIMMNSSAIGEQIVNISIQIFNVGIQAFNFGINKVKMMNVQNFYDKLRKISEQIKLIIKGNNIHTMNCNMLFQTQMPIQHQINNHQENYMNIGFGKGKNLPFMNLIVKYGTTVEEVLNQFMQKVYGFENYKIYFLYNAMRINRNEKRKIENFFRHNSKIEVYEKGNTF